MKKSIAMIMCVLTISLFLMQYSLVSHDNFEKVVYSEKELGNDYAIQLPHTILSNDFEKTVQIIEETCNQYNANLFITKSQNEQYTKYICGVNIKEYQDILGVQSLYKASTETSGLNQIEKFDNSYSLTMKPLSDIKNDGYELEGEAIVTLKDAKQYESLKLKLNTDLSIDIQEVSSSTGEVDMMPWIILSIFAFYLIFILLITYDLFHKYNQFAIYKLNGYSTLTIWKDYVLSIVKNQVIVSIPLFSLLTFCICQRWNAYVFDFLKQGLFIILIVILLSVLLSTFVILHFAKVKIIDYLKNKSVSRAFMIFNQFILFCVVVIVVALTSVGIQRGYAILSRYHNYDEWQKTKDYYILSDMENVENSQLFTSP